MDMRHKSFDQVEVKADQGTFTALASVFGNVDSVGDRMLPGSFAKTLERWRMKGDPIPVFYSHQWDNPESLIGKIDPNDAHETDEGLIVEGQLDIKNNPRAKLVWGQMKERLLKGWSFGYTIPDGGQKKADDANEISEVELIEVGPTLVGANPEAQLQAVKTALEERGAEVEAGIVAEVLIDGKAVWNTAYINDLPDSSFLYIAPGGSKDSDGKTTPRSLRYFPYKDASGAVDLPHLRNALARIPQSNLPQDVKDRVTAKAQRILDNAGSSTASRESEDRPDEEPATSKANSRRQDPLRDETDRMWLESAAGEYSQGGSHAVSERAAP